MYTSFPTEEGGKTIKNKYVWRYQQPQGMSDLSTDSVLC